jgi:hypothetical protein
MCITISKQAAAQLPQHHRQPGCDNVKDMASSSNHDPYILINME